MKIRLIMVDARDNHNKFWFADVNGSTVVRRWGRVGSKGQTKTFHYYDSHDARRETEDLAYSKRRKGYKDLELLVDNEVQIGNAALKAVAGEQIATNGDKALADLVEFLVQANVHAIVSSTSVTYDDGQLQTPLGPITPAAVAKASKLLDEIAAAVKQRKLDWRFDRLVERYLAIVPQKVGRKLVPSEVFGSLADVDEQRQVLDAMDAVVAPAQVDATGQVFSVSLEKADKATVATIQEQYRQTASSNHTSYGMRVKHAYKVEIDGEAEAFREDLGNVWMLWHGTKASNLLSILKQGLIIVPQSASHTTGAMFGNGIYFSDQSTKALNYATTYWGGKDEGRYFMLLCKVALGKAYTPRGHQYSQRYPVKGYDSTHAKGGMSGVQNNEMVVYKTSQVKIEYIVEFTRR